MMTFTQFIQKIDEQNKPMNLPSDAVEKIKNDPEYRKLLDQGNIAGATKRAKKLGIEAAGRNIIDTLFGQKPQTKPPTTTTTKLPTTTTPATQPPKGSS